MSEKDKNEIYSKLPDVSTVHHLTYSNVFTISERPIIFVYSLTMTDGTVVDINMAFYKSTGQSRFTGLDDTWLPTLGFDYKSRMLIKAEEYFLYLYGPMYSLSMSNVETQQVQDLMTYKRFITQKIAMVSYYLSFIQVPKVLPEHSDVNEIKDVKIFEEYVQSEQREKMNLPLKKNVRGGGTSLASRKRPGLTLKFEPEIKLDFEALRPYYDYKIVITQKQEDVVGKKLGEGADKIVYEIDTNQGPKAEVKFKVSLLKANLTMVYKHLELLKRYLETGGEEHYNFIIPKLYRDVTSNNPTEMIMDLVPATCLKTNKKLNENPVIRDFLAFCANVGVEPIDVEYCVDDDGKIYFYDFGNIKIRA